MVLSWTNLALVSRETAMAKTPAPLVTAEDIKAYLDLDEKRKALQRETRALEKLQQPYADKIKRFIRAKEPKSLSATRCGYRLSIKLSKAAPQWKHEYIAVQGVEAAEALIAQQPERESLQVEAIGS